MKSKALWCALPALLIAILVVSPVLAQVEGPVAKVEVLKVTNFVSELHYMLDLSSKKLVPVNESEVRFLDYELEDLSGNDSYVPVVVLSIDKPQRQGNEVTTYAWILRNAIGRSVVIAVADINGTSVTHMRYYKISPVHGDVAIVRTSYDIVIEGPGYKLSIPLSNYTNPKLLIFTDSQLAVQGLSYIALRALTQPPSGYRLVRSGQGEATFTISASGEVTIWFDETHDRGDVDLFIFDSQNPAFQQASASRDWSWLAMHCDAFIWADAAPESRVVTAHGQLKLVVKGFSGDYNNVHWEVAIAQGSGSSSSSSSETETNTAVSNGGGYVAQPSHVDLRGWWHSIESALGGPTIAIIVMILFVIAIVAIIARR